MIRAPRSSGPSRRMVTSSAAPPTAAEVTMAPAAGRASVTGEHSHHRCPNGYVALTYDDGPTAATLPALLDQLRAAGARATFFIQGNNAEARPDLVRAEQRAGMWIGNHTDTHPHLPDLGELAAFKEILGTQRTLRRITGRPPTLFRPPYGETNDQVRRDETRLRLLEVLWTVDSRDWAGATTDEIVAAARTLQPGGIILMHDWAQASVDAVPRIVGDLRERGLCPGRIAFTPKKVPFGETYFHATAVAP
ncbi:polysaccharide deacetylase family protein [Actinomadura sp. GTD37]|uniref:polysaccharide deacetylase family protein n=1 Tax=Actinomadura sp. GTD37 TaxID=1778030 RepID=UPI0035C221D0